MKFTLITVAAFAALTWAAPLSKRQCYIDECGVQTCIDNPVCTTHEDGSVTCVAKREDSLQKRQCYISEDGEQHCVDKPQCYKNDDGSVYEVSKTKRDESEVMEERDASPEMEKRQCYVTKDGKSHCSEKPKCYTQKDGKRVCVS